MDAFLITWRPWSVLNIFAMFLIFMLIFYLIARGGRSLKSAMVPKPNNNPGPYGFGPSYGS